MQRWLRCCGALHFALHFALRFAFLAKTRSSQGFPAIDTMKPAPTTGFRSATMSDFQRQSVKLALNLNIFLRNVT